MKRSFFLLFLLLPLFSVAEESVNWSSDGTARITPVGRYELGLIHTPWRYGLQEDLEISSYVLWMPLLPNISAKKLWVKQDKLLISSQHGLNCPTPLLRFVAREDVGGLLPDDNYIPIFLVFNNYLLLSYPITEKHWATFKIGGKLSLAINDQRLKKPAYQRMTTIDYPLIFPRTAYLTKSTGYSFDSGLQFNGAIISKLEYLADLNFFLFPIDDPQREVNETHWALEAGALLAWRFSPHFSAHLGSKFSVGSFPFGHLWQFYPLLDVQVGF